MRETSYDVADFSCQEYFKFDQPWAWLQSAAMVGGMAVIGGAANLVTTTSLAKSNYLCYNKIDACGYGGIGRRARFRFWFRKK
jgi:hypothetical protein